MSPMTGRPQSWRLLIPFIVLAITWLGGVAIGRYFEGGHIVSAVALLPSTDRFHYLKQHSNVVAQVRWARMTTDGAVC